MASFVPSATFVRFLSFPSPTPRSDYLVQINLYVCQYNNANQMKRNQHHCIMCGNKHNWDERMLMAYGERTMQIKNIVCKTCADKIDFKKYYDNEYKLAVDILNGHTN